ncbi:hypothetical protein C8J57DRAFT_1515533 [Mycena rebaudengoi]|nr:hypothetical protein C8J57DRAFT_1515533 [Mycena rebaudengoi]
MASVRSRKAGSGRVSQLAPEQLSWLESRFNDFCDKQARNTLGLFWPKMERDWFKQWPVEVDLGMPAPKSSEEGEEAEVETAPVSDEDKLAIGVRTAAQKKKLHGWFNTTSQKLKKKGETVKPVQVGQITASLFKAIPPKPEKRTRASQPIELFQRRYRELIESKMKAAGIDDTTVLLALVPAKLAEHGATDAEDVTRANTDDPAALALPVGDDLFEVAAEKELKEQLKRARLKLRREVTKQLYDALPEEERLEMESLCEGMRGAGAKLEEGEEEGELGEALERTPEEYQAEIDALPGILREVHTAIERLTGWTGATILGGPMPNIGGRIVSKTFCFGVSPGGRTLVQSIEEWEGVVSKKTGYWLSRCNPREVRDRRALPTQAATKNLATTKTATAASNQVVTPPDSIPEEVLPAPKKTRKHKPAKTAPTAVAAAVSQLQVDSAADSGVGTGDMGSELGGMDVDTDSGADVGGGMDWEGQGAGTHAPCIDPILLGLGPDLMTSGMTSDGADHRMTVTGADGRTSSQSGQSAGPGEIDQREANATLSEKNSRPTPRATYKGATGAPVSRVPVSEIVAAFGELRPQSAEARPPSEFPFPAFVFNPGAEVRNPLWSAPAPSTTAGTAMPTSTVAGGGAPVPSPAFAAVPGPSATATVATLLSDSPSTPARFRRTSMSPGARSTAVPPLTPLKSTPSSTPPPAKRIEAPAPSRPASIAQFTPPKVALTQPATPPAPPNGEASRGGLSQRSPAAFAASQPTPPPAPSVSPPAPSVPPPAPPAPTNGEATCPGLSWNNFPQSRPLANAPSAPREPPKGPGRPPGPKGRGKAKGKGKGKENPPTTSEPTIPRKRKAAEFWRQMYDDEGNVVQLAPGGPTGELSKKRKRELLDIGKGLDAEATAAAALKEKAKRLLANPDGLYPAVIWVPPRPVAEGSEVVDGKRARKPAKDRDGREIVLPSRRKRGELRGGG